MNTRSDAFYLMNLQVNRKLGNFDLYAGSENIANYIQPNAIIDPENPFGSEFDPTLIYGPVNGRTIYLGIRYKIHKHEIINTRIPALISLVILFLE